MKLITITQGKFVRVDDDDFDVLNQYSWFYSNGYAVRRSGGNRNLTVHLAMHRQIINCPAGMVTDHINQDKLDNRKSNLRVVTRSQNAYNSAPKKPGKQSIYKGVCLVPFRPGNRKKSWRSFVTIKGKKILVGCFKEERHAALARDLWEKDNEYAILNFVKAL